MRDSSVSEKELKRLTKSFMVAVLKIHHEGQSSLARDLNRAATDREWRDLNSAYRFPDTTDPFYMADIITDISKRDGIEKPLGFLLKDRHDNFILNNAAQAAKLKEALMPKAPKFASFI